MSLQSYLPSSSSPYFSKSIEVVNDLTDRVFKTESWSFAYGGNGDIWKANLVQKNSGHTMVAVKVIRGIEDPAITTRFLREMSVWSMVVHPNITPLLGVVFNFDRPRTPGLVCPFYRHGDILKYLKNQPNANKLALILQAALAIAYLHKHSIIHGDIKAKNILVNDKHESSLTDFGVSRVLCASGFTSKNPSATLRNTAYELIGGREKQDEEEEQSVPPVTEATDVWAFAMTVLEILTGTMPFSHLKRDASVINFIMSGGRPKRMRYPQINNEIWNMLEKCWDTDPIQRPSMASLTIFLASQKAT